MMSQLLAVEEVPSLQCWVFVADQLPERGCLKSCCGKPLRQTSLRRLQSLHSCEAVDVYSDWVDKVAEAGVMLSVCRSGPCLSLRQVNYEPEEPAAKKSKVSG